jgi:CBS domain-containing protein
MKNFVLLYVKDAMVRDVVTVRPDMLVSDVEELFEKYDYNSIPVVEGKRMVGIVTKLDFLRHFIFTPKTMVPPYEKLLQDPVSDIMNRSPLTVSTATPLTRVLELMVETKLRSFPVTDADMTLLGIISREDIIRKLKESAR